MKSATYSENVKDEYSICILASSLRKDEIYKAYIENTGLNKEDVMALDLFYADTKKTPATVIKEYFQQEVVPVLGDFKVKYLIVADADYFKVLTKSKKTEANLGYVVDCSYGPWKVVYVPNYKAIFYDPIKIKSKIKQGIDSLVSVIAGKYVEPGNDIIRYKLFPKTYDEIEQSLIYLLEMEKPLAIDIETFSLKHPTAGIGTIAFAWDKHSGIAFPVDYSPIQGATEAPYGRQVFNAPVRELLKFFFLALKEKAIYHSISFDVYNLIYQLFMEDIIDNTGLLQGISVMLNNWEDTKLISYLATNSCAGNKLSLKDQAQAYCGNYAMDNIKDITKIPLNKLLQYNLVDTLGTWYVYEKNYPKLVLDDQLDIYENIFKPATLDIIQMQLTGLPVNMVKVIEVKNNLIIEHNNAKHRINNSDIIKEFNYTLNEEWVRTKNEKYKKKRITLADAFEVFNPNSSVQLQKLLFEILQLPVVSYTDNKQPSTDGDTLKALLNYKLSQKVLDLLTAIKDFKDVDKILNNFIPAIEKAFLAPDSWHYLFGNFNLGGTVSGRLSSSDPNLQNLPANSRYAKMIKSCFAAPPGWLFCGLDFDSLEDKISALTTKDPNKLKVYTDGYDGHSLRAFTYFPESMPDIINTVESINSIKDKYPFYRQESKAPTFALTYQGTFKTLMTNCGFSVEKAMKVEKRYHELYVISDQWVSQKLDQASKTGYITAAFGLRVRTPLLHQVVRGTSKTPFEAEAEGRTAGNALGQSWCLLNSRSASEFMSKVRTSKYATMIKPCAHIHDAQYYLIKDDVNAVYYTNLNLVAAVKWQNHPDIYHEQVRLSGSLAVFYPHWGSEFTLPNNSTKDAILELAKKHFFAKKK